MDPITRADPPHVVTPPEPERREPPGLALETEIRVGAARTADWIIAAHFARNRIASRNRA